MFTVCTQIQGLETCADILAGFWHLLQQRALEGKVQELESVMYKLVMFIVYRRICNIT